MRVVLLRNDDGDHSPDAAMRQAAEEDFHRHAITLLTPSGLLLFSFSSGGTTGTPKLIPVPINDYYYSVRRSNEICGFKSRRRGFLVRDSRRATVTTP